MQYYNLPRIQSDELQGEVPPCILQLFLPMETDIHFWDNKMNNKFLNGHEQYDYELSEMNLSLYGVCLIFWLQCKGINGKWPLYTPYWNYNNQGSEKELNL